MVRGRQERRGVAERDEFKYWRTRSRSFDWELGKWNHDELVNLIQNCHFCGKSYKNDQMLKEHMMERVWVKIGNREMMQTDLIENFPCCGHQLKDYEMLK